MEKHYTSGQLSKLTGVSKKTLRYYHDIGLLEPDKYTESGYKLYGLESLKKLQKILMLKYLQFPLTDIKEMINDEKMDDNFSRQKELIEEQIHHLNQVLQAIKHIQSNAEYNNWKEIINIIKLTQQKEELIVQYKESDNLQKRINIHEYSTADISWYNWLFDKISLKSDMNILEIGCGTGQYWIKVKEHLPENLNIILTDNSEKMLETAKNSLNNHDDYFRSKNISFSFRMMDAENLNIEDGNFDLIMANHMLYHISDKKRYELLLKCRSLLKEHSLFCATTVGKNHLKELFDSLITFDERIEIPNWMTKNFELDNGKPQLEEVFSEVNVYVQDNNLCVPDSKSIIDYVYSFPGNAKQILKEREKDVSEYFSSLASDDDPFFISKETGVFLARK